MTNVFGAAARKPATWLQRIAACALAFAIGIGPAFADGIPDMHEGGQGRDKERTFTVEDRSRGEGIVHAAIVARAAAVPTAPSTVPEMPGTTPEEPPSVASPAPAPSAESPAPAQPAQPPAVVDVAPPEEDSAQSWTRTTSRTVLTPRGIIRSVTRSFSYAIDEEGNRAVAKAVAIARAPNDVAAVLGGAGRITAKTSVDVTGSGAASADAGGSIAVRDGRVEVGTWGRTSAEVF